MMLALKIDVDTLRGTREGVPRLVELLRRHGAGATFLFSVGPDHTGRAIRRVFRPGFVSKVKRTSVVQHYGIKTLMYGTLLPGPDIGRRAGDVMRHVRDEGFEVGVHSWDHTKWQDGVAAADAYYGKGYQDVQNRVPKITNTSEDLDWKPVVPMDTALKHIFDAYRGQVAEARRLVD